MKSKRFTKNDWIARGSTTLANDGPEALTIDILCENAGKTKGSFYFHFDSIEEYLELITKDWIDTYTIEICKNSSIQSQKLDFLNRLAARIDLDLEVGIRQLAARNSNVQELVNKADDIRINWLAGLYQNSGQYNQQDALALANIEIAAFTGFKLIKPNMRPTQARDLYSSFLKLTSRN